MRRLVGGLVLAATSLVAGSAPALAHNCAEPVSLVQGVKTTVKVGVTVGDEPADELNLEFDDIFKIAKGVTRPGWVVQQEGSVIRFSKGKLEPATCMSFDVPVTAQSSGTFRVRAFQRLNGGLWSEHPPDGDVFMHADGSSTIVNHEGVPNPEFEQVLYVSGAGDTSSGVSWPLLLVTVGAVVAVVILLAPRRKRRRTTPRKARGGRAGRSTPRRAR